MVEAVNPNVIEAIREMATTVEMQPEQRRIDAIQKSMRVKGDAAQAAMYGDNSTANLLRQVAGKFVEIAQG